MKNRIISQVYCAFILMMRYNSRSSVRREFSFRLIFVRRSMKSRIYETALSRSDIISQLDVRGLDMDRGRSDVPSRPKTSKTSRLEKKKKYSSG